MRSIARVVRWQVRSRLSRGIVEHHWIGGAKLLVARGMPGATGNVYLGMHEFSDMAFTVHLMRRDERFCDIGANVGTYTVLAAALSGARCDTFEPDPGTSTNLAANVAANGIGDRVTLHQCALGAENGSIAFTVGLDTINRVATPGEPHQIVAVRRLDDVIAERPPRLIKIDVEGHEDAVFDGADKTLASPELQAIIIESAGERTLSRFARHGFVECHYNPFLRQISSTENEWVDNNRLFIRETELKNIEKSLREAPAFTVFGMAI